LINHINRYCLLFLRFKVKPFGLTWFERKYRKCVEHKSTAVLVKITWNYIKNCVWLLSLYRMWSSWLRKKSGKFYERFYDFTQISQTFFNPLHYERINNLYATTMYLEAYRLLLTYYVAFNFQISVSLICWVTKRWQD